jgi:hypothetical protein
VIAIAHGSRAIRKLKEGDASDGSEDLLIGLGLNIKASVSGR